MSDVYEKPEPIRPRLGSFFRPHKLLWNRFYGVEAPSMPTPLCACGVSHVVKCSSLKGKVVHVTVDELGGIEIATSDAD